ncbi:MAG: hypothetical protein WC699_12060 [Bacteroidales bacterium]|jgi:hypothetical protein
MKALKNKPVLLLVLAVSMFIIGLYATLGIPSKEGFNPSDDGVILAQSYRMLQGEVPHRDFISIRPAGSAVMHLIHFFSPIPLEISARWMVLIEYLIYSIMITLLLTGSWFKGFRKLNYRFLVAGSVVGIFILNQNHYNFFPWTTIDGLFWFSIALYSWFRVKSGLSGKLFIWQVLVWLGVSCAVLCRQTFALPGAILVLRMVVWVIGQSGQSRQAWVRSLLLAAMIGLVPGWIYASVLTYAGAWPDFFQQMTGRTELWETGVVTFIQAFWHSPAPALFGLAVISGLIKIWSTESGRDSLRIDVFLMLQKYLSFGFKIALVFLIFIKPAWLFQISLFFFWMLILDILLIYFHDGVLPRWIRPAFWILLVAWTSAISLGDNAPIFALGWLAGTAILIQIKDFSNRIYRKIRPFQTIAGVVLLPLLLLSALIVQTRVNYRDLPAKELTKAGGDIFPGLRGIRLSPAMSDYLGEIRRLYLEAGAPKGRFAVWPNNALIYPLLGSPNPFILDWMQPAEFVGNEKRVMESIRKVLLGEEVIILVEKVNIKWITTGNIPVDSRSADYGYLRMLDSLAIPLNAVSNSFNVYRTK